MKWEMKTAPLNNLYSHFFSLFFSHCAVLSLMDDVEKIDSRIKCVWDGGGRHDHGRLEERIAYL